MLTCFVFKFDLEDGQKLPSCSVGNENEVSPLKNCRRESCFALLPIEQCWAQLLVDELVC